jgi:hypothetical protein
MAIRQRLKPQPELLQPAPPAEMPTAATLLEDPLQMKTYDLSPAIDEVLRGRLLGKILKSLTGFPTGTLQEVALFVDICENDHGCTTPAEEFITDLVVVYRRGSGLTPDQAAEVLDKFRESFTDALGIAKRFNALYADVLAGE